MLMKFGLISSSLDRNIYVLGSGLAQCANTCLLNTDPVNKLVIVCERSVFLENSGFLLYRAPSLCANLCHKQTLLLHMTEGNIKLVK